MVLHSSNGPSETIGCSQRFYDICFAPLAGGRKDRADQSESLGSGFPEEGGIRA